MNRQIQWLPNLNHKLDPSTCMIGCIANTLLSVNGLESMQGWPKIGGNANIFDAGVSVGFKLGFWKQVVLTCPPRLATGYCPCYRLEAGTTRMERDWLADRMHRVCRLLCLASLNVYISYSGRSALAGVLRYVG